MKKICWCLSLLLLTGMGAQPQVPDKPETLLSEKDWTSINSIAASTFRGFQSLIDPQTRLPVDIAFVDKGKVTHKTDIFYLNKTSPTNIGLGFLYLILARDHRLISAETAYSEASAMLTSMEALETHQGFLFNWYHLTEVKGARPKVTMNGFVSSLDNGIMDLCLMAAAQAFKGTELERRLETSLAKRDYKFFLGHTETGKKDSLLNLGWDDEAHSFHTADYGMFITEARMVVMMTIVKDKFPEDGWIRQTRNTRFYQMQDGRKVKVIESWGGSLYEMLFAEEILGAVDIAPAAYRVQAAKYIDIHRDWAKKTSPQNGIWGIANGMVPGSEDYAMAGVPALAAYPTTDAFVVPYASFLSLRYRPSESLENLLAIRRLNPAAYHTSYGYVDSIDPVTGRFSDRILALDKGMEVLSIGNLINRRAGLTDIPGYVWLYFKRKGWNKTAQRLLKADETHPSFTETSKLSSIRQSLKRIEETLSSNKGSGELK